MVTSPYAPYSIYSRGAVAVGSQECVLCPFRSHLPQGSKWEFPQIRGTILGVPMMWTTVFWGLYWGPLYFGKLPNDHRQGSRLHLAQSPGLANDQSKCTSQAKPSVFAGSMVITLTPLLLRALLPHDVSAPKRLPRAHCSERLGHHLF